MTKNNIHKEQMERFQNLEKKMSLSSNLERKLIECLLANVYYQNALDVAEAENEKTIDPKYTSQINWHIEMHKQSFLQDSMLFAGNRLLIWLKLYMDSYSIKNSGLEEVLRFKAGIKYLRDVRTHDYNYSLFRKKDKKKSKVKENYKNYIVENELGSISPNITYTFKDSKMGSEKLEDQQNIGGRFRFDLFTKAVEKAYIKTKKINFFDINDIAQEHFELETLIQETINAT